MLSKIKKDPTISKQQRMVIDIIHTANWLDEKISKILRVYGITHPQFNILKNVQAAHPEPLSVKEIKDTIMFTNSDVTRLIDRLVNKGLLNRETCSINRRKVDISITEAATALLDVITEEFNKTFGNFYESEISIEDALRTSEILRLIRK
jgi:DNA-binding MarR family transcriptional regulator